MDTNGGGGKTSKLAYIVCEPGYEYTVNEEIQIDGLISDEENEGLSNITVKITIDNNTYTTTTDQDGTFTQTYTPTTTGQHPITITIIDDTYTTEPLQDTLNVIE